MTKEIDKILAEICPYYRDRSKRKMPIANIEHNLVYDSPSETLEPIYFFILAIDALRPRKAAVSSADLAVGTHDNSGLRFFGEILRHKKDDYWTQVQEMDYPRVNRELAYQIHGLANLIRTKYDAIATLYSGMRILTLGAAAIIVIVAGAVSALYFSG